MIEYTIIENCAIWTLIFVLNVISYIYIAKYYILKDKILNCPFSSDQTQNNNKSPQRGCDGNNMGNNGVS